jgi:hypothetical protein
VATAYFARDATGRLYWDYYLDLWVQAGFGGLVSAAMPSASVNGQAMSSPPYGLHPFVSPAYDFHASLYLYNRPGGPVPIEYDDRLDMELKIVATAPDPDIVSVTSYLVCRVGRPGPVPGPKNGSRASAGWAEEQSLFAGIPADFSNELGLPH